MSKNTLLGKKILGAYLKPDSVGLTIIIANTTGSREEISIGPPVLHGDSRLYASALEPLRELVGKTILGIAITDYIWETCQEFPIWEVEKISKTHRFTLSLACQGETGPWHYVFDWEYTIE